MPKPKPGEVWLVRFPFTELTSTKVRPALVLADHRQDLIVLGIFSKVPAGALPETWVLIEETHPEFGQTGLKKTSSIRAMRGRSKEKHGPYVVDTQALVWFITEDKRLSAVAEQILAQAEAGKVRVLVPTLVSFSLLASFFQQLRKMFKVIY